MEAHDESDARGEGEVWEEGSTTAQSFRVSIPCNGANSTRCPNRRMAYELKEAYSGAQASLYFRFTKLLWDGGVQYLIAPVLFHFTKIDDVARSALVMGRGSG